jgi:quercetin dioxygenase-like cupin family protein
MYETFCKNLNPVIDKINIIKEDSLKAVNRYKDESIDFLFIDSDHEYTHFCKELKAYLPKIKPTGIIAGHDAYYPDVEKAIKEFFPSAYEINGFSWFHYKDHFKLRGFKNGWFIGNFDPSLLKTEAFEVAVQTHKKGFIGQKHYHSKSTEYNVVLDGKVNINGSIKEKGDIFVFLANQISESEFLEDTQILVVRTPSAPEDKVII